MPSHHAYPHAMRIYLPEVLAYLLFCLFIVYVDINKQQQFNDKLIQIYEWYVYTTNGKHHPDILQYINTVKNDINNKKENQLIQQISI